MPQFDAVIIGAGPGGYVAAIRGAQHGLKVALIEENHLGGTCLNWGCIPTKALLRASELYHIIGHAQEFGLTIPKPTYDFSKMIERSRKVAGQLAQGVQHLMKKNKVSVLEGRGRFKGKAEGLHLLEIKNPQGEKHLVKAKNVIIATGARPRPLPGIEYDPNFIWTSKEAMMPQSLPNSLLVVGSGAIGIEFASFYAALGTKVTVVEIQNRILPAEDEEISTLARKSFEKKGIRILTESSATSLTKEKKTLKAVIKTSKESLEEPFDKALIAIGVLGNTEDLGLETTKVQVEKNQIVVNEWCQTHEPGVYAIGDIAGPPWLAHKASHEGVLVATKIAGIPEAHPINKKAVPGCTYSHPQIASIGLTESQARASGHDIKVGRFPFMGNGKAIALGEPEGLIKTIFNAKTGELLGAHLIGPDVTEMIQGFAIAMATEATEAELMQTIFPHPTLSEMMHESVLDAFGQAIHI